MSGLITYNGQLLIKGGGLAGSKGCCCTGVLCYCFAQYTNYGMTIVSRFVRCYRMYYYNPVLGTNVFPDGVPAGWGDSPCQPDSFGWFFRAGNDIFNTPAWPQGSTPPGFPSSAGCGGVNGSGHSINLIDSPTKATACSTVLPPP